MAKERPSIPQSPLLEAPLGSLELSIATSNALNRAGFETIWACLEPFTLSKRRQELSKRRLRLEPQSLSRKNRKEQKLQQQDHGLAFPLLLEGLPSGLELLVTYLDRPICGFQALT